MRPPRYSAQCISVIVILILATVWLGSKFFSSSSQYILDMSSPATMSFSKATALRRSLRQLQGTSPVPDSAIVDLAREAIRVVPSAFNSQTTRLTVLLRGEHEKLWSITADALVAKIGKERYNSGTKAKIDAFAASYGTILFWDDQQAVKEFVDHTPDLYKDKTDEWVHQSNGMHQYYMWTALEAYGMGANLQHYNPIIDESVRKTWSLSPSWALRAQMVFGTPKEGTDPGDRVQKTPVEDRAPVFGAHSEHGQL